MPLDNHMQILVDQLVELLQELVSGHEKLMTLAQQKRHALRTAQFQRVTQTCEDENQIVQQISELEKRRLQLVADLTLAMDPQAKSPLRMAALAEQLPEPHRGRLLVMRQQLIQHMEAARKEINVARQATESLVAHMQGLMQSIGSVCNDVNLYGSNGAPPQTALALSTFHATA